MPFYESVNENLTMNVSVYENRLTSKILSNPHNPKATCIYAVRKIQYF